MANGDEGVAIWMIGVENGFCECYEPKKINIYVGGNIVNEYNT